MSTPHRSFDAGRADPAADWTRLGQPASHRRPPAGWLMPTLSALAVLLLIAALTTVVLARRSLSAADDRIAALQAQQQADAEAGTVGVAAPALDLADLKGRYAAVTAADKAVDTAASTWKAGGSQLKIVWESVGRCMYQVDQYNRAAAWFTPAELNGLPGAVDLTAAATDCGGATLAKNAKGAGF